VGVALYVIFEGKRRQRIIPIIEPPRNTSLEFVQTIGDLYYQHQDHADLAHKKIHYLLTYLRQRFGLKTQDLHEAYLRESLLRKTSLNERDLTQFLEKIDMAQRATHLTEQQLIDLNAEVESFYKTLK
jgi:hypothetical protein